MNWWEDNPVGTALVAVCALFVLSLLIMAVVWILPVTSGTDTDADAANGNDVELPVLADTLPIESFAIVGERPLFSETRRPVIEVEIDEDALADGAEDEEEELDAPDIQLTGIVITPSLRMATLRRDDSDKPLLAFVGQPLRGNYGSWQVSSIEAREVVLTSDSGKELQLNLQVHDAVIDAPPEAEPESESDEGGESPDDESVEEVAANDEEEPLTRAEEIRQRIAQRREELKRAAEEKGENAPPSYQDAINSMMDKGRKKPANAQNDENNR